MSSSLQAGVVVRWYERCCGERGWGLGRIWDRVVQGVFDDVEGMCGGFQGSGGR